MDIDMDMDRRQWMRGAAALAALGAGCPLAQAQAQPQPASAQASALWQHAFEQPAGGMLRMAALRGRPLLVNFWATWCAPCVKELPLLERWAGEQHGATVVGIAVDRVAAVREFLKRTPVRFPIGVAGFAGTELARQLGNPQGALPYSLLVGRDGRILARKLGETHEQELREWARLIVARGGDSGAARS